MEKELSTEHGSADTGPEFQKDEAAEPRGAFQFDEYAVDWPVTGQTEGLSRQVIVATLRALERTGEVTSLSIGQDVPVQALKLREGFQWFEEHGYFTLDRESWSIKVTDKWRELFLTPNQPGRCQAPTFCNSLSETPTYFLINNPT